MSRWERYLPWGVVAVAVLYLASCAIPRHGKYDGFDLDEFATLPVLFNGRVLPLDSVARNTLMVVSGRQTFITKDDERQPAIVWLMDVLAANTRAKVWSRFQEHEVFRIENEEVLNIFGLKLRSGLRYSYAELEPRLHVLKARAKESGRKEKEKTSDLFDLKVLELSKHINLFDDMLEQASLATMPFFREDEDKPSWASLYQVRNLVRNAPEDQVRNVLSLESVNCMFRMFKAYSEKDIQEKNLDPAEIADKRREQLKETSGEFNKALVEYRTWLKAKMPAEYRKVRFETFFNRFAPFYQAIVLNIMVFLLACCSWLTWQKGLGRSAFALGVIALLVQTAALFARMYIMDRPFVFVTNLYSSAVFIGWGSVGLGLFLEYVFRNGVGCVVGSVCGASSLFIAHYLSLDGDTMNMLVAVLDTNFWLATHVTCITCGYTATYVAGFIGIYYVLSNLFNPNIKPEANQDTTRMIYGVLCFATMLSFTGTVLGGIWADQSWGRFWGWDPKENGALLIVLMNALTLHARWAGLVKARGLAVLSILGNIVVSWSWFGVNMLSVGLHNYGFMAGVREALIASDVGFLLLAGLGMCDPKQVRSFLTWVGEALGISAVVQEKVEVHS